MFLNHVPGVRCGVPGFPKFVAGGSAVAGVNTDTGISAFAEISTQGVYKEMSSILADQ